MARTTTAKERIVSVADRILNERGTDHVTIREILRESEQNNMSAIKYYFGDRDGLLRAVFRRRRLTLNLARRERLRGSEPRADYARFAARMTPRIDYSSDDVDNLDPADQRIIRALRAALSELPPTILANRIDTAFNMIVGVFAA